jgi:hypothetical protein
MCWRVGIRIGGESVGGVWSGIYKQIVSLELFSSCGAGSD